MHREELVIELAKDCSEALHIGRQEREASSDPRQRWDRIVVHLIFGEVPDEARRVACPELAAGYEPAGRDDCAGCKDAVLLHERALHQDAAVPNHALVLDRRRPQQAALPDRHIPPNGRRS